MCVENVESGSMQTLCVGLLQVGSSTAGGVSTGEAAAPAMAGATVAAAHCATADEEGVHRGAVTGRGNVRFTEHDPSTSQARVDMARRDDAAAHTHDRDDGVYESRLAGSRGREASFGGSLRTPLTRVDKGKSAYGHAGTGVNFSVNRLCDLLCFTSVSHSTT